MPAESSAVAWHRRPAIGLAGGGQERVAPHDGERRAMSTQRAAALCFALFVFAGYYKAADLLRFVPFDLTLAFWLTTAGRSEEHTSELQSLMRISYAVFCLKKKKHRTSTNYTIT